MKRIIVVTASEVCGRTVTRTLGLVRGNTIRARHLGRDMLALLRNIVGGEITEYTKLIAEAREQAIDRMLEDAAKLDADAVVSCRFTTSVLMGGAAELLAYGTAVQLSAAERAEPDAGDKNVT
jgi:uncharacterized protein YbjQ (UPF0145 family)